MAISTNTPVGTLNRLRGSVVVTSFPDLNVTASNLGAAGIGIGPEAAGTLFIDTMTGRVTSPVPYVPVNVTIALLRTQALAAAWMSQYLTNTVLGELSIVSDAATFPDFNLTNAGMMTFANIPMNGTDPVVVWTLSGTLIINSNLWSAA